jgi:8-oxo-dGTP pyrophosphatase MutT (NUDIX family)
MNELDAVTDRARTATHPNRRPLDAATLILVDRTGKKPKVLMGKRHRAHTFLPEKYVFPGGRVDAHDRAMPVARPLHSQVEAQLMKYIARPSRAKAQTFALTAIRETFEETGLLIGVPSADYLPAPPGPWRAFASHGYYPDLSVLRLVARAITPPRYVLRFDARFFTADASAIVHRVDGRVHGEAELIDLKWLPIGEALRLDLPDITYIVLQEIRARVSAGFEYEYPVPFFRMRHGRFVRELL